MFASLFFVLLYGHNEKKNDSLSKKVKNFTSSHVLRVNNVVIKCILTWFLLYRMHTCCFQLCDSITRFFTLHVIPKEHIFFLFQANNSIWHRQNITFWYIQSVLVGFYACKHTYTHAQTLMPWPYLFCIFKQIIRL